MQPTEIALLISVAGLLIASIFTVRRRHQPRASPPTLEHPPEPARAVAPSYSPPDGSFAAVRLAVGQTIHIRTGTARYALTLLDPDIALYDAVRTGGDGKGGSKREAFQLIFCGTQAPGQGLVSGWFIPSGNMRYHKIKGGHSRGICVTTAIRQILFSIPVRQAS